MWCGNIKLLLSVKKIHRLSAQMPMKSLSKPLSIDGVQLQERKISFLLVFILFHLLKLHLFLLLPCLSAFLSVNGMCHQAFPSVSGMCNYVFCPWRREHVLKDWESLAVNSFLSGQKKKGGFTFCLLCFP